MSPSILIVGAGPGGLMTALELNRRKLGQVRILERSKELVRTGDAFTILPPALSSLSQYPEMRAEFDRARYDAIQSLWKYGGGTEDNPSSGMVYGPAEAEWNRPGAAASSASEQNLLVPWLCHRYKFIEMLLHEVQRQGILIEWGVSAAEYGEDVSLKQAWVKTSDSRKVYADLVVAADGVGTKSHAVVTGKPVPASSSGYAILRASMPTETALASDWVKERIGWRPGNRPEFRIYVGPNIHLNLILTDDIVMPIMTHKDTGNASEGWHATVPTSYVLETANQVHGWDPALLEILNQLPDHSVVDWRLMWRDPQPKWTSDGGRIIQVGDAAHSFLPTSGNGATQAIEDTLSLAACLEAAGSPDNFPSATRVHNLLRFERTSTLQKYGFVSRQSFHHLFDEDGHVNEKMAKNFDIITSFGKWIWTHNPALYAQSRYAAALSHLEKGTPFENTNLPPGYKYQPWTIAEEMEKEHNGVFSDLKEQGDWSF